MASYHLVVCLLTAILLVNHVKSQNEPTFDALPTTISIPEDQALGSIYTVAATDLDGDTLNFNISAGDTSMFSIGYSDGVVTLLGVLDFETTPQYTLTIDVFDPENVTTADLTIDITNVNEISFVDNLPATVFVQDNNTADTVIFTAVANDTDPEGHAVTFVCTFNPDDAQFYCDTNGDVHSVANPTYQASSYDITVQIDDGSITSTGKILSVQVVSYIEQTPHFDNLPNTTVLAEDTATGTTLYSVIVWDPDNSTHGTVDLSLISISPNDSSLFILNGTTIILNGALDYETAPSYTVTLEACDSDGCSQETLTVTVTNVDEAPEPQSHAVVAIPENSNAPYVLYLDWNVTDPDGDVSFTFSLSTGGDNSYFDISPTDGNVTFSSSDNSILDYENTYYSSRDPPYLELEVLISDSAGTTATVTIPVYIEDVDEFDPILDADEYEATIKEGQTYGDIIIFSATDEDGGPIYGEVLSYEVGAPGNEYFAVDSSGSLFTWKPVDLEELTDDDLVFYVYAKDGGDLQDTALVTIHIEDVNDFPPVMDAKYTFTINSNADIGTLVGLAGAIDLDLDEHGITYHQISNTSDTFPFFIGYLDGWIVVNGELEADKTYTFFVYAEDSTEPTATSDIVCIQIITYDGEATLVDWELDTSEYYYPSDLAQFEENLRQTCAPCTPKVVYQYENDNGNTVLKVKILKGNSTELNPDYYSKEEILDLYTSDGVKTPTDEAAGLAPKGNVISINEAYETPPSNWLIETIPGNIVLACICLVAFGLVTTGIAALLDRFYWTKRPEYRKYEHM